MELNIKSIKGFFWIIVRSFYSLIPASSFLFFSYLFICSYKSHFPPCIHPILSKIENLETANSIILFVLTAFILTFINDTISEILPWDNEPVENKGEKEKTPPPNYNLKLQLDPQIIVQDIRVADIGIADLVGVKLIEEYENVNAWTFQTMALKDMLLAINNYINIFLILFLPFSLSIEEYKSSQFCLVLLLFCQIILTWLVLYIIRKPIFKFKKSENWKNDTITDQKQIRILFLFPLGGVLVLAIPTIWPNCLNGFIILISVNAFLLPIKLFIALTARNYHNNVRKMVNSAFFQIRFNDKIFKNNAEQLEKSPE